MQPTKQSSLHFISWACFTSVNHLVTRTALLLPSSLVKLYFLSAKLSLKLRVTIKVNRIRWIQITLDLRSVKAINTRIYTQYRVYIVCVCLCVLTWLLQRGSWAELVTHKGDAGAAGRTSRRHFCYPCRWHCWLLPLSLPLPSSTLPPLSLSLCFACRWATRIYRQRRIHELPLTRGACADEPQSSFGGAGTGWASWNRSFDDGVRYCCVLIEFSLCDSK